MARAENDEGTLAGVAQDAEGLRKTVEELEFR